MGHSLCTETKGGEGAVEEERAGPQGERGREVDGKGRRDHFVFPFRMAFMV